MLHEFILSKARQIHKELMEEEEDGMEDEKLGEDDGEEFYGDQELDGEGSEDGEGLEGSEDGSEGGEEGTDDAGASDDLSGDLNAEEPLSVEELTSEVRDIQADMAQMTAEFEKLMGAEAGEEEHEGEFGGDDEGEEGNLDEPLTGDDGLEGEPEEESFQFEEFEDLDESFELEPVKVEIKAGKEIGQGPTLKQNSQSPIPQEKVDNRAFKGKPVQIKATEHSGYEREASPSVKEMPQRKNQVKSSKNVLTTKDKEGGSEGKSALINKTEQEFGGPNDKSPIGSKGSRTGV